MQTRIIDGAAIARAIREKLKLRVVQMAAGGCVPGLAVIQIGENPASAVYVRNKIRACADARIDKDFVINARTDALAVGGIDEVVRRGNAYLDAGATMVFVDGLDSKDAAREAVRRIAGPVAINLVEGGKSPTDWDFAEIEAIGIARVSLPATTLLGAIQGMRNSLAAMKQSGSIRGYEPMVANFRECQQLFGMNDVLALEQTYLGPLRDVGKTP